MCSVLGFEVADEVEAKVVDISALCFDSSGKVVGVEDEWGIGVPV